MKKLILGSAIAAAMTSTSAFAFDLYEKDDFKFEVEGEYTVQFQQDPGEDENLDVVFDDLELVFKGEYEISDSLTAFGRIDADWNDGSSDLENGFVGLASGPLSVSLGNLDWGSDDFGVEKAFEFDGGTAFEETGGNESLKFVYEAGNYTAALSFEIAEESDEFGDDDESGIDLYLAAKLGNVDLEFVYQDTEAADEVDTDDVTGITTVTDLDSVDAFGLSASTDFGPSNVGIDYTSSDETDFVNLAADYTSGKSTFAAGLTFELPDEGEDVTHWYLNGKYDLHDNANLFAEIANSDIDDSDLGFVTGMQFEF